MNEEARFKSVWKAMPPMSPNPDGYEVHYDSLKSWAWAFWQQAILPYAEKEEK